VLKLVTIAGFVLLLFA